MNDPIVSKSKYIEGLRCPKLLWYEFNRKSEIPGIDAMSAAVMEEGKKVGVLAQTLFPEGIMLGFGHDFRKMHARSMAALGERQPLFEAGFLFKNAFAIADILVPVEEGMWDIIEVKSSTDVKDEHIPDIAFQKFTYSGAGVNVRKCFIMHINNQYVKNGPIEADKLFVKRDVTADVDELLPAIKGELDSMVATISSPDEPEVKIGPYCNKPRECPLTDLCKSFLPEDNIFILYRGGKFLYDLLDKGILKITDIPLGMKLNDKQIIQIKSHKMDEEYIDKDGLNDFLNKLKYPLHFLDFETMAPAIPIFDGTRPYEAVPFQYSLHVIEKEGSKPKHYSYIAPGDVDPRLEILKKLKELLGTKGSMIAYNATFEIRCLRAAAEAYPEFKPFVETLEARVVDMMGPFLNFTYYTPKQEGSYSMKKVLPALTGKSYEGLEIAEGEMANREYYRVIFGGKATEEDKRKVFDALERYCELDTKGMIDIFEVLKTKVRETA